MVEGTFLDDTFSFLESPLVRASGSDAFLVLQGEEMRASSEVAFSVDEFVVFRTGVSDALAVFKLEVGTWAALSDAFSVFFLEVFGAFLNLVAETVLENEVSRAANSLAFLVFSEGEILRALVSHTFVNLLVVDFVLRALNSEALSVDKLSSFFAGNSDAFVLDNIKSLLAGNSDASVASGFESFRASSEAGSLLKDLASRAADSNAFFVDKFEVRVALSSDAFLVFEAETRSAGLSDTGASLDLEVFRADKLSAGVLDQSESSIAAEDMASLGVSVEVIVLRAGNSDALLVLELEVRRAAVLEALVLSGSGESFRASSSDADSLLQVEVLRAVNSLAGSFHESETLLARQIALASVVDVSSLASESNTSVLLETEVVISGADDLLAGVVFEFETSSTLDLKAFILEHIESCRARFLDALVSFKGIMFWARLENTLLVFERVSRRALTEASLASFLVSTRAASSFAFSVNVLEAVFDITLFSVAFSIFDDPVFRAGKRNTVSVFELVSLSAGDLLAVLAHSDPSIFARSMMRR